MTKKVTLKIDSAAFYELLGECIVLRGQYLFDEAIELVEPQLGNMEQDAREAALLQLLYIAAEAGYGKKTRVFAKELAKIDPEIPAVKKILHTDK